MEMRTQNMTRYITPMREGGSLPLLGEADDGFKYVVKMRGAGHGAKALVAELIGGEIARALGLRVPELVFLNIDEDFGRTEGDEEVQDLLKASRGLNLGLHFLNGALTMDPYSMKATPQEAALIIWLDAYITNVDRTVKNTNMLNWHGETWLIDHGASLYFHHSMTNPAESALSPFAFIKEHVLLLRAADIQEADAKAHALLTPEVINKIVSLIPDEWLECYDEDMTADELRSVYRDFLISRLNNSNVFTDYIYELQRAATV